MKRNSSKILAALCLALAAPTLTAQAQETQTSYFMQSGTYRHQMNPAFLADPYVGALLGNLNVETEGNVGMKNFVYELQTPYTQDGKYYELTTFMNPEISAADFLGELPDKTRIGAKFNYNFASVGFKAFGGVNLVELNMKVNTDVSMPKSLFEMAKTLGEKESYSISDLGARAMGYGELAFGHSRQINPKLRIGAKVKMLFGLAYADFDVKQLDLTLNGDAWSVAGDARLQAALMKTKFEHEGADKNDPATGRPRVKGIDDFAGGLSGFGVGFDLGATYKLLPELELSASLTDLGFISYSGVQNASSANQYTFDGFDNIYAGDNNTGDNKIGDQFEALGDDLEELFSVYDDGEGSASKALAATLNLGADYTMPFYDKLHVGLLYTGRFAGKFSRHQAMLSAVVRPVKVIEVGVSSTFHSFGTNLGAMLSLRGKHVNFFLGADSFIHKFGKQGIPLNAMNANVNFGLSFPL